MKKSLFLSFLLIILLLLFSACKSVAGFSDDPQIDKLKTDDRTERLMGFLLTTDYSGEVKSYQEQMAEAAKTCEHTQTVTPSFVGVEGGHKMRCKYCKTGMGDLMPHQPEAFRTKSSISLHGDGEATLYEARCSACFETAECYIEVCLHQNYCWVQSPISKTYRKTCNDCQKQFGSVYNEIPEGEIG